MDDPVYKPFHYTQGDIECIDAMVAAFGEYHTAIYCKLNAFKYLWRADLKNPDQDLEKAIWYLNFAIGEDPRALQTSKEEVPRETH